MRRAMIALAAILVVLLPGTPAWAHNQLVSSEPAKETTLATAPVSVTLEFLERLRPDFTTIVVSDATKRRIPAGPPAVDGAMGTVALTEPLGNGAYTVAYRVVSTDGHTVQGSYTFTVADPAKAPPRKEAAVIKKGGMPAPVLIGLAALGVVLAATAVVLYLRGRRKATD